MRPIVQKAGTRCPYIACNGAQIVDSVTGDVLVSNEVGVELAREALLWLEAKGVYCQVYNGDDWFYAAPSELADSYGRSSGVKGTLVGKLSAYIDFQTPKLLGIDEPSRIPELIAEGNDLFAGRLSLTTSKPYFLEITSPKATKGNAVQTLSEMLGFTRDTTLCAGDSLNDLSMLRWSTRPVTVSNAREEVKRMAWRIAGDGREDGIAALLDELIPTEGFPC